MSLLQVIVLAIVQGLAELLPVSSSAHVIVAEKLMGLDPSAPQMTLHFNNHILTAEDGYELISTGPRSREILFFQAAPHRPFLVAGQGDQPFREFRHLRPPHRCVPFRAA